RAPAARGGRPHGARARAGARGAAPGLRAARRRRAGRPRACAAQGHHVGPRARGCRARLLPRLPGPLAGRARGPPPGPLVAGGGRRDRAAGRPRPAGRRRAGADVTPLPASLLPDSASVDDEGRLRIGGVDVLGLAEHHGTPLFVYDEAHLRARCREARDVFGEDGAIYATKAFLCRAMARLVHEEGLRLDVATGGELEVVLSAGVPAARLVLHGNNKSDAELA